MQIFFACCDLLFWSSKVEHSHIFQAFLITGSSRDDTELLNLCFGQTERNNARSIHMCARRERSPTLTYKSLLRKKKMSTNSTRGFASSVLSQIVVCTRHFFCGTMLGPRYCIHPPPPFLSLVNISQPYLQQCGGPAAVPQVLNYRDMAT